MPGSLHHLMKLTGKAIAKTLPISLQSYEMPCQKGAALALDCLHSCVFDQSGNRLILACKCLPRRWSCFNCLAYQPHPICNFLAMGKPPQP